MKLANFLLTGLFVLQNNSMNLNKAFKTLDIHMEK